MRLRVHVCLLVFVSVCFVCLCCVSVLCAVCLLRRVSVLRIRVVHLLCVSELHVRECAYVRMSFRCLVLEHPSFCLSYTFFDCACVECDCVYVFPFPFFGMQACVHMHACACMHACVCPPLCLDVGACVSDAWFRNIPLFAFLLCMRVLVRVYVFIACLHLVVGAGALFPRGCQFMCTCACYAYVCVCIRVRVCMRLSVHVCECAYVRLCSVSTPQFKFRMSIA